MGKVDAEGRNIKVLCRGGGSGINLDINVTERIGLAGQSFGIQCDTVLVAGIKLTVSEHQFQLFEQYRESQVKMA